jgi:hypothetical protein
VNAMCLGTQQRQIAEGNPDRGFHPVRMARRYCRVHLHRWTSVVAGMAWVGPFFLCFAAQFLIATRHRGRRWGVIAFAPTARAPPRWSSRGVCLKHARKEGYSGPCAGEKL